MGKIGLNKNPLRKQRNETIKQNTKNFNHQQRLRSTELN